MGPAVVLVDSTILSINYMFYIRFGDNGIPWHANMRGPSQRHCGVCKVVLL